MEYEAVVQSALEEIDRRVKGDIYVEDLARAAHYSTHHFRRGFMPVTGTPVADPGTWLFRIGTPVSKALELAGGVAEKTAKGIFGGPMMCLAQRSLDVTVTKNTSGILLMTWAETSGYLSSPCIRCGRCVDACPMKLQPGPLSVLIESEDYAAAERSFVMDCMECGVCTYVCPAKRPLVQHFRRAKAEIQAIRRSAGAK